MCCLLHKATQSDMNVSCIVWPNLKENWFRKLKSYAFIAFCCLWCLSFLDLSGISDSSKWSCFFTALSRFTTDFIALDISSSFDWGRLSSSEAPPLESLSYLSLQFTTQHQQLQLHQQQQHEHEHEEEDVDNFFGNNTVWVKKIPPEDLWQFFQNGWEFFNQILYAYYAFLSTLDYDMSFNYLQLWRSYALLSVTTQFTSCAQNVHHWPKRTLAFSDILPKQLGSFRPNFTRLLNVHMYAIEHIFIHYLLWRSYAILSATTQCAFRSMVDMILAHYGGRA